MSKIFAGLMALAATACLAVAVGSASAAQNLTDLGGWWRFNENTGTTINDSTANNNHGTLSGGAWIAGKFGSGLDFATPGYVQVPSDPTLESQTITAEAWVKYSGTPGKYKYILAKGANANFAASYALDTGPDPGDGIRFYVANCSVFAGAYHEPGPWDGNWHRVTGTYGGGNVNLYVDGALVASTASNLTIEYDLTTACGGDTNDLSSGDYLGGADPYGFPGAIDEPRVWTRTLSVSDVGDTTAPTVTVSPLSVLLGQASVSLSATATDPYGVVGGEYSLDAGTWTAMTQSDSALSATIDTSALAPGVHQVQVRATDYADNTSDPVSTSFRVYSFSGFFQPVDNLPTLNTVKAGQAVPVKFSLSGNQGLNIFATGYPKSQAIVCNSGTSSDDVEQTLTAGSSSLSYDATTDQYTYVWKTDKAWAGTCRQLVVQLSDASIHLANFQFKK